MQLLLRKLNYDADGQAEYLDTVIDHDVITIGSSLDCELQLLGVGLGAFHTRLIKTDSGVQLLAESGFSIQYKDQPVRKIELQVGDEFSICDQLFTVAKAPSGFDLALEWNFKPVPGHLFENAYQTSIDQLRFSPRAVSWVLVVFVLAFAGLAPVMDYWWRSKVSTQQQQANTASFTPPSSALESESILIGDDSKVISNNHPIPLQTNASLGRPTADSFWLSGPLLPAHEVAMGDRCEACHQQPFVQVKDEACASCHTQLNDHLNALHPEKPGFEQFRCQNCHKEHNEPVEIVSRSNALCSQCHSSHELSATAFSSAGHPEFSASLLIPNVDQDSATLQVDWQRQKFVLNKPLEENNHLVYPHDVHLDPLAVTHQQRGDALLCADCHELNTDGEHFSPITMERHCADCHELTFDRSNPQKQLPHGEPAEVFDTLRNYFVDLSFNPLEKSFERRRLPGKVSIDERCVKDYDCAITQAQREAEKQFLQSGCVTCHEVRTVANSEAGEQWQVLPVKLSEDWFPNAYFDHRSHLTPSDFTQNALLDDNHQSNDGVCLACHQASVSMSSADVLMPNRSQCTSCHGSSADGGNVALKCISCHGYHSANEQPFRGDHDVAL